MKLAALKFKRKQAEAVSTYNIMLCSGRSPLGRIRARHVNGLETWASSQKKNTLTINKINANNIYLLTTYSWRETRGLSDKGSYNLPSPYALLFLVTVRKEQRTRWSHLILWLCLHHKNLLHLWYPSALLWTHSTCLPGKSWSSGEVGTQRGWISALLI